MPFWCVQMVSNNGWQIQVSVNQLYLGASAIAPMTKDCQVKVGFQN
jgi:hypothetical protein